MLEDWGCAPLIPGTPSYRDLLVRYSFPAFEFGPLMFFANTGEEIRWELATKLFADRFMFPKLLEARYIQIGNPYFDNYDPVCIESPPGVAEGRVVQLDHEEILIRDERQIVREIALGRLSAVRRARIC
jgi:hypothetical protein